MAQKEPCINQILSVKAVRIFNVLFSFIELNLLFLLIIIMSSYLLFNGREKDGTIVTLLSIIFFILSISVSAIITKRINLFLWCKSVKLNMIYFVIILLSLIFTLLLFGLSNYTVY